MSGVYSDLNVGPRAFRCTSGHSFKIFHPKNQFTKLRNRAGTTDEVKSSLTRLSCQVSEPYFNTAMLHNF